MVAVWLASRGPILWSRCIVFVFFIAAAAAQPQGLSYACGAKTAYTSNGISWTPDTDVAPQGMTKNMVGSSFRYFSAYNKSNPQKNLHCYDKIDMSSLGSTGPILLRVTYEYSNYDGLSSPPEFEMWIATTKVATINLSQKDPWVEEVISTTAQIFCMVAIKGAPVISFLELRPLPPTSYAAAGNILRKEHRIDCGNEGTQSVRFPDDEYDRLWDVDQFSSSNTISAESNQTLNGEDIPEKPPAIVLETLRIVSNGLSIGYKLPVDSDGPFNVKIYSSTDVTVDDVLVSGISPSKLAIQAGKSAQVFTFNGVNSSAQNIDVSIQDDKGNSPQISALEVFQEITPGPQSVDDDPLKTLNSYYHLDGLNWVGDPCLPIPWQGIQCINSSVISVDISYQDLIQPISQEFANLVSLTHLNLSNNRMSSTIPDLTGLDNLEVLDLRNNDLSGTLNTLTVLRSLRELYVSFNPKLSGPIPTALNRSTLLLEFEGTCIGQVSGCVGTGPSPGPETHKNSGKSSSNIGAIAGGVGAAVAVSAIVALCLCFYFHKRKAVGQTGHEAEAGNIDLRNWSVAKKFTYKELEIATNRFAKELGEGSFGPVYLGVLITGQKVAIKMRQDASQLGSEAFANEVYLLSRVHHPNLVSLLGYCHEGRKQLLVYEFMSGGTLMDHLYGSMNRLDWITRLQIAIGAATGISYLHNGIDPKIIHRDVKSTNILLDSNMTAKVSDFGLSKLVTKAGASHVSTLVKGTAGYLDPEYFITNHLTEKSDVYSFGVVLLEIICGREPLTGTRAPDEYNLIAWAKPYLQAKTYTGIVDKRLHLTYNPRCMSIVAALALRCIEKNSSDRPTMLQVRRELEEALLLEDRGEGGAATASDSSELKRSDSGTPSSSAPGTTVPSFTFGR